MACVASALTDVPSGIAPATGSIGFASLSLTRIVEVKEHGKEASPVGYR